MPEPFVGEAAKLCIKDLFDIQPLKIPIWWNAVIAKQSVVKSNRAVMTKFYRAMMEAIHYIKTDKEGTKAIYSKNLKLTDPEGLERAYQAYVSVFPENLLPTADGVKTHAGRPCATKPKGGDGRSEGVRGHEFGARN